jgi:DNA (cytosine-5)-methyltransferase 1
VRSLSAGRQREAAGLRSVWPRRSARPADATCQRQRRSGASSSRPVRQHGSPRRVFVQRSRTSRRGLGCMLTIGSLFSGVGGFDLGLERTGHMQTVWFCEQDEFCQRVLAKHWPGVPCHPDVRALVANTGRGRLQPDGVGRGLPVAPEGAGRGEQRRPASIDPAGGGGPDGQVLVPVPYVDVLCGGFPCQDLSYAGRGAGLDGERSGLWTEYARLIRELRPRYVIVENVSALLARGLGRVLGDLAACGYDAEWDCIPASAVGAPHRRDRVWLVAYRAEPVGSAADRRRRSSDPSSASRILAYADEERRRGRPGKQRPGGRGEPTDGGWWLTEPDVGRVAHGVPARVDRLRSLGNALVPQIAEWIGHRILEHEEGRLADAA